MTQKHSNRLVLRVLLAAAALPLAFWAEPAAAVTFAFNENPFAGTAIDPNDGVRQISGGTAGFGARQVVNAFDVTRDSFTFDRSAFGLSGNLVFQNAPVGALVGSGPHQPNFVALRTTDNDGNPATPFGAGNAASLIAGALGDKAPGFFIYHNSGLALNRLVFSTDLSDATADLAILAAFATPTGADGIAALADFKSENFSAVPLPATAPLLAAAMAALGLLVRRRRQPA